MFFCGFAKFYSVPLHYFSFLLNLFPCANDSGLFHLGDFCPELDDCLDVHSHWRLRSKNPICGFALRCVGRACQLVNFTDRDQVVSQPFQGETPNGIFCKSFLCSSQFPQGGTSAFPLDGMILAASKGRSWMAELPPFNDCKCWLSLSLWYQPQTSLLPSAVHYIQSPFGLTPQGKNFRPCASRRQRRRKRNSLVAWVREGTWGSNPRLPGNPLYSVSQLLPASYSTSCHRTSAFLLGGGEAGTAHSALECPSVG